MTEIFIRIIAISPIVVFLVLIFKYLGSSFKAVCKQWTLIANDLHLKISIPTGIMKSLMATWPTITGKLDGFDVSFTMESQGSRHRYWNYTTLEFTVNQTFSHPINIISEGLFEKIAKKMGATDIQIGDEKFDDAFIIECGEEEFAKKILTPSIQQKLLSILALSRSFEKLTFENNLVSYTSYFATLTDADRKYLLQIIEELKGLANEINNL